MNRINAVARHVAPGPTGGESARSKDATLTINEFFNAFEEKSLQRTQNRIAVVLSDDFSYVGGDGTKKDKRQFVDTLPENLAIHIREKKVYLNGNGAGAAVISVIPSMNLELCEVFSFNKNGLICALRVHK